MRLYRTKPLIALVILICVLLLAALVGCTSLPQVTAEGGGAQAAAAPSAVGEDIVPIPLKVAVPPYLSYAPFYIAAAEGYFEEEGLDVELVSVTRAADAIAALAQGQLDVAGFPISSALLNAIVRDSGLKIVASKVRLIDQGCTYSGFVVRKGGPIAETTTITTDLLKSLRYDVNPTGISGYILDVLLQKYGLSLDDITLVDTGTAAVSLEVMQQGGLDLAGMTEPFVTQALATGAGDVWLSRNDVTPDSQLDIVAYGPTLLKENPEAGNRFMVAYLKAVHRFAEGMSEPTLALLEKELELDRDLLSKMCAPYIPPDGAIDAPSIVAFGEWAAARDLIDAPVTEEMFWDGRFVDYANQVLKDQGEMKGETESEMNGISVASALVAKQQAHARHAHIIQEAKALSQDILEKSLVACFEQQAAKVPRHIAIEAIEGSLTYQELNEAANRLAHHLLAMGIPITTPVAILLERSLNTVVSILAVLKVGGYYLYLEPALPVQRARDILNRATTKTIITTSAFAAYAEEVSPDGSACLLLDQMVADNLVHNPNIPISPLQPSRLGFTSGSTGTPKPSLKSHENYLYGAWQGSNAYLYSPLDRHAFVYQFSAGSATRATCAALLTGGSVHLYPGVNTDMNKWAAWIEAQEITLLYMPTVAFRELLHTLPDGPNFPSVRMVFVGGQTIYRQDAELFQRRFCPGAILVSRYSMSETSALAHYLVDHDTQFEGEILPLGYALPGRDLLIVDEEGRPLGFNQPGEIVVRRLFPGTEDAGPAPIVKSAGNTPGSANGTQKADDERAPFFHTSDMGLLRPDGCLIHLGRKDDMVKVRGNRVALAEAENLLLKVSGVAQAAIKPFPTPSGDNRLVGYVAPAPDAQLTVASVREAMSQLAPAYMVPARFVLLPAMPLTTTGKVDRQALPLPATTRPELQTPFVAAHDELEQQIADIWAELLEVDEVGVNDNFFDLGGDSMSAMRMILKVEALTGATIPQSYVCAPTVAALAAYCSPNASAAPSDTTTVAPPTYRRPSAARRLFERLTEGEVTATTPLPALLRWMIYQRAIRLSYAQGIRWLAWLGQPSIANRLFSQERRWLYSLAQELDSPAVATAELFNRNFSMSVVGNLLRNSFQRSWVYRRPATGDLIQVMRNAPEPFWRTFALGCDSSAQDDRNALYHYSGLEHLVHAQKRKQGTILVTYHGTASALANAILTHQTDLGRIPTISLERAQGMAEEMVEPEWRHEWDDMEERLERESAGWAASYALQAQRILQNGGVVRIVNDVSYDAANSLSKTVGRRRYNLKPGFAGLALITGATVLPVYSTFDNTGRVHAHILPALEAQAKRSNAAAYVHELLDQYLIFLESTWRKSPDSIGWGSVRRYTNRPHAEASLLAGQSAQAGRS